MEKYKNLVLRGNRQLGSALIQLNLVSEATLSKANEKLIEALQSQELWKASLLRILIYDLEALQEDELLESSSYPLVDLRNMEIPLPDKFGVEFELCEATSTLPFHMEDGFYFLATTNNLSQPIIDYWKELLNGHVIWYTTDLASVSSTLDKMRDIILQTTTENVK